MIPVASSPLSQQLTNAMRSNMAVISAPPNVTSALGLKMPQRFMQHSVLQHQPMFSGMDPRMVMMMGRNIPGPSVMMRGHLQPFRPRFM